MRSPTITLTETLVGLRFACPTLPSVRVQARRLHRNSV